MPSSPTDPLDATISPYLTAAFDQLAEGVIVTDERGAIVFINRAAAEIHGTEAPGVLPEDYVATSRPLTMEGTPYPSETLPLARAVKTGETVEDAYWQIEREDGTTVIALGTARPVLDEEGAQVGAVLTLRNETERIADQRALRAAVDLKDLLLREIHHRVKNNLQLVSSLLNLQGRKTEDLAARDALSDLSSRVDVIADIHRALYDTGETDTIEVVAYLARLSERHFSPLAESFGVAFNIANEGACILPIEKATSVALGVNELVLNSLQHAFSENVMPAIDLAMRADCEWLTIDYRDNGDGSISQLDLSAARKGFGQLLVTGLEKQLGAVIAGIDDGSGFQVTIKVPLNGNVVAAS